MLAFEGGAFFSVDCVADVSLVLVCCTPLLEEDKTCELAAKYVR